MKRAVASIVVASSTLLGGCAVYPDGTPAYGGGYPGTYDQSYGYYGYPGPAVQAGVYIGGGSYFGGPGPRRYWNDSPGYRHRPPDGWHGRHGDSGHGGNRGGGNRGGLPPQAGGGRSPPPPAAVGGPAPSRPAVLPQPNISRPGGPPQRQSLGPYGG
jgi:hypothetical protein